MSKIQMLKDAIMNGEYDARFKRVYVTDEAVKEQHERYVSLANDFAEIFSEDREARLFSAPGRTEVGGNHTDHNHGRVLAAGINLDAIAVASKNDENIVRVKSRGYKMDVCDITDLEIKEDEKGHSPALVRGMCAGFLKYGYKIGGFDAVTMSSVLSGSGLSSSAAYEVLVGTMLNYLYNDGQVDAITIAKIAQYAENVYFDKPCGLMDQMACSVGNLVHIDFENPKEQKIEKLDFNMSEHGYSLCITDTKGSHADLTAEYAAVPQEMKRIANHFGKEVLREVEVIDVIKAIPQLREKYGDRSVLRALHFFTENERVKKEVNALKWGDMNLFLDNVKESGDSSFKYLQNVYSNNDVENQNISIALMMSDVLLKTEGVSRVHGGGFAGTIQAFVKNDFVVPYKMQMDSIYGEGSCKDLRIRKYGGMKVI